MGTIPPSPLGSERLVALIEVARANAVREYGRLSLGDATTKIQNTLLVVMDLSSAELRNEVRDVVSDVVEGYYRTQNKIQKRVGR